eukprot:6023676-Prorocentrum_lima.AAC.1
MNSPPLSECNLNMCTPKVPLSGPRTGRRSIVPRISLGTSAPLSKRCDPWNQRTLGSSLYSVCHDEQ